MKNPRLSDPRPTAFDPDDEHRHSHDMQHEESAVALSELKVGNLSLLALSDGVFRMPVDFISAPEAHGQLADHRGRVVLPVGAFLLPSDEPILVDAGYGPRETDILAGGNLPSQMQACGIDRTEIRAVAISHLHDDHIGWLADRNGDSFFPNAATYISHRDWDFFMADEMTVVPEHIRYYLLSAFDEGRIELMTEEQSISPSLTAIPAPGHTPGHTVYAVANSGERALLLGDAIYCPQQLGATDWQAVSDLDPVLAKRTRERLVREIQESSAAALGCHFPGLRASRALGSHWVDV